MATLTRTPSYAALPLDLSLRASPAPDPLLLTGGGGGSGVNVPARSPTPPPLFSTDQIDFLAPSGEYGMGVDGPVSAVGGDDGSVTMWAEWIEAVQDDIVQVVQPSPCPAPSPPAPLPSSTPPGLFLPLHPSFIPRPPSPSSPKYRSRPPRRPAPPPLFKPLLSPAQHPTAPRATRSRTTAAEARGEAQRVWRGAEVGRFRPRVGSGLRWCIAKGEDLPRKEEAEEGRREEEQDQDQERGRGRQTTLDFRSSKARAAGAGGTKRARGGSVGAASIGERGRMKTRRMTRAGA